MEKVDAMAWWPLVRRTLVWGLAMACSWGWFPFLLGGELGLLTLLFPDPLPPDFDSPEPEYETSESDGFGDAIASLFLNFLLFLWANSCVWVVGGAITGGVAAFLAPATAPTNPFKSPFYRRVGRQTFWSWFGGTLGPSLFFSVFSFFSPIFMASPLNMLILYYVGMGTLYIGALQPTLDEALESKRSAP